MHIKLCTKMILFWSVCYQWAKPHYNKVKKIFVCIYKFICGKRNSFICGNHVNWLLSLVFKKKQCEERNHIVLNVEIIYNIITLKCVIACISLSMEHIDVIRMLTKMEMCKPRSDIDCIFEETCSCVNLCNVCFSSFGSTLLRLTFLRSIGFPMLLDISLMLYSCHATDSY